MVTKAVKDKIMDYVITNEVAEQMQLIGNPQDIHITTEIRKMIKNT